MRPTCPVRPAHQRWPLLLGAAALGCTSGTALDTPITVDQCFVVAATMLPATPSLAVGDTVRLLVTYNKVAPACLPSVPASSLVMRSTNPAVASVDSTSGLVTARSPGQVTVSASVPGGAVVTGATAVVTVRAP